jgi:hypothetical protein
VNPDPDERAPHRYRSLIVAGTLVVAVIAAGLLAGSHHGASVTAVKVRFGASVQPPAGKLSFTNGWVASSGRQRVAVYAGSQAGQPSNGILFIAVHVQGQRRREAPKLVPGSGALTLLRPGHFSSIQAAGQATLHFVTANGGTGTLNLSDNRVSLSG